jgi:epoxyqueuosine reductase QueG
LDDAKAVIVYAVKYKDVSCFFDQNWFRQTDELMARIDKKLTGFLTEKGYKAHSFLKASAPHNLQEELRRQALGESTPPNPGRWFKVFYKMRDAAVSAGLGCLNKNMMIIIPNYGPYFYLSMIITDAPLKPDKPFTEDLCKDCNLCIEACPKGALTGKGLPDISKCKPMECKFLCLRVCNEKFTRQKSTESRKAN